MFSNGRLTGEWQPDGRNIPRNASGNMFDSLQPTATLRSFDGMNPNGQWVLFVCDLSPGNQATLESWDLNIIPLPEPACFGTVSALALSAVVIGKKYGSKKSP
jgi:hypothetical protein